MGALRAWYLQYCPQMCAVSIVFRKHNSVFLVVFRLNSRLWIHIPSLTAWLLPISTLFTSKAGQYRSYPGLNLKTALNTVGLAGHLKMPRTCVFHFFKNLFSMENYWDFDDAKQKVLFWTQTIQNSYLLSNRPLEYLHWSQVHSPLLELQRCQSMTN